MLLFAVFSWVLSSLGFLLLVSSLGLLGTCKAFSGILREIRSWFLGISLFHLGFSWVCGDGAYIAQGVISEADGCKQVREVHTRAGGSTGEGVFGVSQAQLSSSSATD